LELRVGIGEVNRDVGHSFGKGGGIFG
jgi:hypothetical protein